MKLSRYSTLHSNGFYSQLTNFRDGRSELTWDFLRQKDDENNDFKQTIEITIPPYFPYYQSRKLIKTII